MAETEKPKVVTPAPTFKFDAERCKQHLSTVRAKLESFAGKRNCNPYIVIGAKIDPLLFALNKGENTKELQDAILSLDSKMIPWIPGFKPSQADIDAALK